MTGTIDRAGVFRLGEAGIEEIQKALDTGVLTAVELSVLYLNRIFAYDVNGPRLNSIPVINPGVLAEAEASDRRRASGAPPRPLEGVPFTVKDSYKVAGLTVAAGSPAFENLVADEDAFTVARIREAGGVLIGKTNMPPLADGGLQRGVYGRAESPYNGDYLTAAWNSGSSNGSGSSTAAWFAAFSMGEETVSSGRSPASNNALCAYTPSRGLISVRGNWPLRPLRDVIVPMTRTMDDLLRVLDVIVAPDPITKGDLWRDQKTVKLPAVSDVRPQSYAELKDAAAWRGKRIGVPTIYIGKDRTGCDFPIRPSILELWKKALADLEALGATVVEVEFPLFHNYEEDRPDVESPAARGLIPPAWWNAFQAGKLVSNRTEKILLSACAWEAFVRGCHDPGFAGWADVEVERVFPYPEGSVDFKRRGPCDRLYEEIKAVIAEGPPKIHELPGIADALRGLERVREVDFEGWMREHGLDCIAFPANGDIGKATSDVVEEDYDFATRRGVSTSNGGGMIRHLGIPTVSVPMGITSDIGMPVNITFAGAAYSDNALLAGACAYEQSTMNRRAPTRTPPLPGEELAFAPNNARRPAGEEGSSPPSLALAPEAELVRSGEGLLARFSGRASSNAGLSSLCLYVNGRLVDGHLEANWSRAVPLVDWVDEPGAPPASAHAILLAKDQLGRAAATYQQVRLIES